MVVAIVFELIFYGFTAIAVLTNMEDLKAAAETEDVMLILEALRDMVVSPAGAILAAILAVFTIFMTGLETAFPAKIYRALGNS
jgi:hypothetical protein